MVGVAPAAAPVDADGRPLIRKLGTIDVDKVETTPVVFRADAGPAFEPKQEIENRNCGLLSSKNITPGQ